MGMPSVDLPLPSKRRVDVSSGTQHLRPAPSKVRHHGRVDNLVLEGVAVAASALVLRPLAPPVVSEHPESANE